MKRKIILIFLLCILSFLNFLTAQEHVTRKELISNDSIFETIIDDTDFSLGYSFLNIGFLGNVGPSNEYMTGDICMKPSAYIAYKRVYSFFEVKFGDISKIKKDIENTGIIKGMGTYHQLAEISIGYDINPNSKKIIPYIGYSWLYMRVENDDGIVTDFNDNSISYNLTFVSWNNPMRRDRFGKRFNTDMFATRYLTIGFMPFNYSDKLKGTYYYFNLGFYFNHKFQRVPDGK